MSGGEIDAIRAAFEAAENRGDPRVQLAHRSESEYVRMPPGRPPMDATEAREALVELYEEADVEVAWESSGVLASGDLAVDSGSFTVRFDDGTRRTGSWLMAFRREDGDWKVVRDIYNWDEPAP